MRVRATTLGIALMIAVIAVRALVRQPQAVGSSNTPDRLYDSDYKTAATALSSLFANASDEKLAQLKSDPDVGVSLYAAWRMRSSENPHFVAASHPERFIGFLEGRTGFTCPPNWAASVVLWGCSHTPLACFGECRHVVELSANDDLVGVFGIAGTNYVEAFDIKTGAPRFRFEPGLWRVFDNPWNDPVGKEPENGKGEEK